jgi:hypothetical protein
MYQVFDPYLERETWHADDQAEDQIFYALLAQIIDRPDFDPAAMGDYIRQAKGLSTNSQDPVAGIIENRMRDAQAVQTFRRINPKL